MHDKLIYLIPKIYIPMFRIQVMEGISARLSLHSIQGYIEELRREGGRLRGVNKTGRG